MRSLAIPIVGLLAVASVATAHDFNLASPSRHETCAIYGDPDADRIGDGHVHQHDPALTRTVTNHDPCKQSGMQYPSFTDAPALREIPLELAVLGDGSDATTELIALDGEAYQWDYPTASVKTGTDLLVVGDAGAVALGLPGTGTTADPYVIEGYLLTGLLELRDTSKCFVVRDNAVQGGTLVGGLIDTTDVVVLETLRSSYESARDAALAALAALEAEAASWDALAETWAEHAAEVEAAHAALEGALATWEAAFESFAAAYLAVMEDTELLAADFVDYVREWQPMMGGPMAPMHPADPHAYPVAGFAPYLQQVQDMIRGNAPPPQVPEGWTSADWADYRARYQPFVDEAGAMQPALAGALSGAPDRDAYGAFLAEYHAEADERATFLADYEAFLADLTEARAGTDSGMEVQEAVLAEVAAFQAKAEEFDLEYMGPVTYLAGEVHLLAENNLDLATQVLELVRSVLPEQRTGRLVLDWNGQCVHAYDNVVEDLRVNQNNDRTGYATGGLLEDNRLYTIGQIRHYDGEFRQNEVGDRDHLRSLVDPGVTAPANDRSINNDGANEGWFHHNLIYGQVDLDFHGHHHSPGFFAPESHYHGSDPTVAYMRNADGTFKLDAKGNKIPHHDHTKRWTSVLFEDNVVIDPRGVGLRFEDEDHRGDDHRANSENMVELEKPHFHRSEVRIQDNVVVGRIGVDTFNADGVWLWNDDWSEVKTDLAGRILDAVKHLGADIVNSHQVRNDGWIDLKGNTQFLVGGGDAMRIVNAKQANELEVDANRAFVLGQGFSSGLDEAGLRAWLRDVGAVPAERVWTTVSAWGGTPAEATAARMTGLRDVKVTMCDNVYRGFAHGVVATDHVYADTTVTDCGTTSYGGASPALAVTTIAYPPAPPKCTTGLRDTTDPTQAKYVLHPGYDVVDGVLGQVCALLPGELTTAAVGGTGSLPVVGKTTTSATSTSTTTTTSTGALAPVTKLLKK